MAPTIEHIVAKICHGLIRISLSQTLTNLRNHIVAVPREHEVEEDVKDEKPDGGADRVAIHDLANVVAIHRGGGVLCVE